ncbi:hypothetical protein Hanom_Chr16g01471421 [Helianthus anomalus]
MVFLVWCRVASSYQQKTKGGRSGGVVMYAYLYIHTHKIYNKDYLLFIKTLNVFYH